MASWLDICASSQVHHRSRQPVYCSAGSSLTAAKPFPCNHSFLCQSAQPGSPQAPGTPVEAPSTQHPDVKLYIAPLQFTILFTLIGALGLDGGLVA